MNPVIIITTILEVQTNALKNRNTLRNQTDLGRKNTENTPMTESDFTITLNENNLMAVTKERTRVDTIMIKKQSMILFFNNIRKLVKKV